MTSLSPPSFRESIERSAQLHERQMWQASQTVRAHVAADGVDAMLECLGLTDAVRPGA